MQCEICGNNIKGESTKIKIDFSEFIVCSNCIKYGTTIKKENNQKQIGNNIIKNKNLKQKDYFQNLNKNIVENYDEIIKNNRIKLNITQEGLANKLKEKVHLIKKLERKEIIPEEEVLKKLEKILNIRLLEDFSTTNLNNEEYKKDKKMKEVTIGDIAFIKQNNESKKYNK